MLAPILALLAVSTAASPVATTADSIRARPAEFDGKWVRLRGQIDQCTNFDCSICPEEAIPADPQAERCLRLDWDRQRGSNQERGADFDPIYRYATVDLVARFNIACFRGICTDRSPALVDARVVAVLKRRTSAEGLVGRRHINRMVQPPEASAAPLIALMSRRRSPGPSGPYYRVFAAPSDPNIERSAIVCRSVGDPSTPGTWPTDQISALFARSTEDRFKCFFAQRSDGRWLISPD